MTPLNFRPDAQGALRASARGFEYARRHLTSNAPGCEDYNEWGATVTVPHPNIKALVVELSSVWNEAEDAKACLQFYADAIERAVEEETNGLRELLEAASRVVEDAIQFANELADGEDIDYLVQLQAKIDAALKGKS